MQHQHLDRYSAAQQRDINLVRLYLQVHTLADKSDTARKQVINLNYLDGVRPPGFTDNDVWPRQAAPTKDQCRLWKRYLRSSFLRYVPYWITDPLRGISQQEAPVQESSASTFEEHFSCLPKTHLQLLDGFQQVATDRKSVV